MTADAPPHRYAAFGLAIASELALPELTPAAAAGPPDLAVRLGVLAPNERPGVLYCAGRDAAYSVAGVGAFRVTDGREIAVDPLPGVAERDVRQHLLGTALGLACHQRRLLPLHASAIVAGGCAVAFAGPSGAGKSTLAAHFDALGYEVLCDDVCAVDLSSGAPRAQPGLARIKLCTDAAVRMGRKISEADQVGDDKYCFPLRRHGPGRVPLDRLYLLGGPDAAGFGVTRLVGAAAAEALMASVFRRSCLGPMGLTRQAFALSVAAARRIGVFRVRRSLDFDLFEREAAELARHFAPAVLEGATA